MARQKYQKRRKKAPEFQCHIKYKNELPLPPVTSVLFDSTLSLPQSQLSRVLRNESVAYSPTSLEKGTKHFSLPAELMKLSVYNMVDMENIVRVDDDNDKIVKVLELDDKEILMSIEELERKDTTVNVASNLPTTSSTTAKFSRPDVTWLRRTEYISSVKNNPNSAAVQTSEADAKILLSEPVKFEEIFKEVEATFESRDNNKSCEHPIKKKGVELVQSYPIVLDDAANFIHCLIFGPIVSPEATLLKLENDQIVTLFNPCDISTAKSNGEFDIQKTETTGKSFVVMLPAGCAAGEDAILAKIGSTFSLRKRRKLKQVKNGKVIKITRK